MNELNQLNKSMMMLYVGVEWLATESTECFVMRAGSVVCVSDEQ